MNILIDALPVILFFVIYKIYNIFIATFVMIIATLLQTVWCYLQQRRIAWFHLLTLGLMMIAGITTLLLHDAFYMKLKPTLLYWVLAIALSTSQYLGKPLIKSLMNNKVQLPQFVWQRLNLSWSIFFATLGGLNLWIVYHYPTDTWVSFKLYGTLGGTILFALAQSWYMLKYLKEEAPKI